MCLKDQEHAEKIAALAEGAKVAQETLIKLKDREIERVKQEVYHVHVSECVIFTQHQFILPMCQQHSATVTINPRFCRLLPSDF